MPGPERLPPGPLRELTAELHELYGAAGRPSLRKISDTVRADSHLPGLVSHEKVSALLHGTGVSKWSTLRLVVAMLAGASMPPRDVDRTLEKFKRLWDEAAQTDSPGEAVTVAPTQGRLRYAFVLGGETRETKAPDFEKVVLAEVCRKIGAAVAAAGVDLVICSPFPDAADFHTLSGYLESRAGGTVHMHMPRHEVVANRFRQLREVLEPAAVDAIKVWKYPGPEKDDDDEAWGQAWLLCQLRAMEQSEVVIAVGGKPDRTASTILRLAQLNQKPVVPFTFLGGAAERAFVRRNWQAAHPGLDTRKLTDKSGVSEVMAIANEMVTVRVRDSNMVTRPPRTVFVSRARGDVEFARALDTYLTQSRLTVLFGERAVPADWTIEEAIEDALLRSDLFIALWSRSYAVSRYCFDEISLALKRYEAGELQLWIINLDGSDMVPPGARHLPQVTARSPAQVVAAVRDLLHGERDAES